MRVNRRGFLGGMLATAAGLWLPEPERVRAYSFMPVESGLPWDEESWQLRHYWQKRNGLGMNARLFIGGVEYPGRIIDLACDTVTSQRYDVTRNSTRNATRDRVLAGV